MTDSEEDPGKHRNPPLGSIEHLEVLMINWTGRVGSLSQKGLKWACIASCIASECSQQLNRQPNNNIKYTIVGLYSFYI